MTDNHDMKLKEIEQKMNLLEKAVFSEIRPDRFLLINY